MKKLLVVSAIAALGLTSVAFAGGLPEEMPAAPVAVAASDAGVYLGIEGGYGLTNWKLFNSDNVKNDNGVVGRAFLGYDINRYFAIEAGYSYFFNKADLGQDHKFKTQAIDLLGKIKAPITDEFGLYAKLGATYIMTKDTAANATYNEKNFNVAYGAGADYSITPNIIANIEWLRLNGKIDVPGKHIQPYVDAFMVGLRYKFDL